MTKTVVAFDVSSTSTGVARADGTTATIAPRGDLMTRIWALGVAAAHILDADKPELVVIEAPDVARGRAAQRALHAAVFQVEQLCWARKIDYREIGPSQLKHLVTGNGWATKDDMIAEARRRGATPANDDEADAFLLRCLAVDFYSDSSRADAALAEYLTGSKKGKRR